MDGYLKNVSVLIVDDQDFIRMLIRQILKAMGCRNIKEASNGNDAWADVAISPPDVIIADWEMQPSNGLEFTRKIRRHPKSPNPFVPIIMMTGHTELDRVIEARDSGISEYVIKPLSAKSLIARIQAVIENPREFIKTKSYFGPDRRRRSIVVQADRRKKATAA